ncbi:hypothetical protein GF324_07730 [bacterium]|nr:hypothetical protein [bacterium]
MATEKKRASVTVEARVPAEITWRNITDARELQIWFAQQTNPTLTGEEKNYSFGGRYVPFMKYDERPDQPVIEYDEEAMVLAFEWPLRGRDGEIVNTTVRYRVSPVGNNSRLDVEHIVGADDLSDDDLRNLWTLLLNGLVFHLEGASAWVRPEFTQRKAKEFRLEFWTAADRKRVFETITTVEGIKGFFAPQVKEVKLEEGGTLDLGWDQLPVISVEEDTRFAFGWREVADEDPNLEVLWELKDEGNGTRVVLTEGQFSEPVLLSSRPDYDGWAAVMNDLKRYLETNRHPIFLSILIEEVKEQA